MDEGEVVERYVRMGLLDPLTEATVEDEVRGLAEDLTNWDHQHPCEPVLPQITQDRKK